MNLIDTLFKIITENKLILTALICAAWIISLMFPKRNRHKRKIKTADFVMNRIDGFSPPQKIAYLRKIDPYSFEELILTCLEKKGFPIKRNERYTGDGGIDGKFFHNGELYLIQAKRYQKEIRYDHLSEFSKLLEDHQCKGIFVHTGRTPKNIKARDINMKNMTIVSGDRLIRLLDTEIKLNF